jgi:TPR repeat protein
MYQLARMSELGMGEEASDARAIDLYTQAAELGHVEAMRRLVAVYTNGELATRPNPQRAAAWSARLQTAERR